MSLPAGWQRRPISYCVPWLGTKRSRSLLLPVTGSKAWLNEA
ncbi:hypothetical protein SAMN04488021_11127 [Paracoccus aminovorans]|uniref:Uncharacterized protein n=1 Tax=Paracoccus aminovorans TaxID=34004 RepID=A0A1I2ZWS7_9RHOB|nr:hypothetical protein [Paracoccus aminovorans]CQR84399.1 hypothetical protein JCM7685_pAMV3p0454 [Paracoccus aminovorans]SFH42076.1 hypothetical protein SAMN04488021_11127 [Paracoccus aminovorans]